LTKRKNNISPDGKWQITIDKDGNITWFDLTKSQGTYTIEEIVEATKNICPELWK
jgi:hypothetical protein|tara:strand:+ start:224 stop:388 length:165 start_codon:yes stop_codon:yes gene_type:complete